MPSMGTALRHPRGPTLGNGTVDHAHPAPLLPRRRRKEGGRLLIARLQGGNLGCWISCLPDPLIRCPSNVRLAHLRDVQSCAPLSASSSPLCFCCRWAPCRLPSLRSSRHRDSTARVTSGATFEAAAVISFCISRSRATRSCGRRKKAPEEDLRNPERTSIKSATVNLTGRVSQVSVLSFTAVPTVAYAGRSERTRFTSLPP